MKESVDKILNKPIESSDVAVLSSHGHYTTFTFRGTTITFMTGKNLVRYTLVKEWDMGYIVVMCLHSHAPNQEIEDYIDLVPILESLYMNPQEFLKPIKKVVIEYVG